MLELKNVSKSYHKVKAVDNVSFTIDAGQTLGIVGANGAGKTTLISMIATLTKPDEGGIMLEGVDLVRDPGSVRSMIGYVPQDIALYETLSGLDNLKFWGRINSVHKDLLKERISQVCRIIRFDVPPTYIVLDAAKVEKGMVKKTITYRWTHSIEKLPCHVY